MFTHTPKNGKGFEGATAPWRSNGGLPCEDVWRPSVMRACVRRLAFIMVIERGGGGRGDGGSMEEWK